MAFLIEVDGQHTPWDVASLTGPALGEVVGWQAMILCATEHEVLLGTRGPGQEAALNAAGTARAGEPVVGPLLVLTMPEWVGVQARTLGWAVVDDPLTRALLQIPAGHGAVYWVDAEHGVHLSQDISVRRCTAALVTLEAGELHLVEAVTVPSFDAGLAWFAERGYAVTRQSAWQSSSVTFLVVAEPGLTRTGAPRP
ncbi:MAG: hypothetical protein H0X24_09895 [Ktedonobacterales bacterium]|nr:hypothetical protein [Ktedonobacterales bacterium]